MENQIIFYMWCISRLISLLDLTFKSNLCLNFKLTPKLYYCYCTTKFLKYVKSKKQIWIYTTHNTIPFRVNTAQKVSCPWERLLWLNNTFSSCYGMFKIDFLNMLLIYFQVVSGYELLFTLNWEFSVPFHLVS